MQTARPPVSNVYNNKLAQRRGNLVGVGFVCANYTKYDI